MTINEVRVTPLTEVSTEPEHQELFETLNAEIGRLVETAVVDPLSLYPEVQAGEMKELYPLSVKLVTLNRAERCDRKLDKALRKRLASKSFEGADGVLVFPYEDTLPMDNMHQGLIEIYPKGMNHVVSLQRNVLTYDEDKDEKRLNTVHYTLSIEPLTDSPLPPIDDRGDTILDVLAAIIDEKYDDAAQILRNSFDVVEDRRLLGLLWRKLRLKEAGEIVSLSTPVTGNVSDRPDSSSLQPPMWLEKGQYNGLKNPFLARALLAFATEKVSRVEHMDFEDFQKLFR